MNQADIESFERIVSTRRSVRIFDQTPIPTEVVSRCLDLALMAPNSSNLQPWEFHWVKTPEKKQKLVEACLSQSAAATAAELIVCVARTKTWRKNRTFVMEQLAFHESQGVNVPGAAKHYYQKLVPFAYRQGPLGLFGFIKRILFFVIGLKKPMIRGPKSEHDMELWATKSTALACENLMLAFRAFDFDTCPMEGFDARRVRSLLDLPGDASVVMVVGAGKRAPEGVTLPHIRGDKSWFVKEW